MNERDIAHDIILALDEGAQQMDSRLTRRLQASRQKALDAHRGFEARLSVAGRLATVGVSLRHDLARVHQSWVMLAALVLFVLGTHYSGQHQVEAEIEEVDSALLSDDLPINAYLDGGFDAWLKHARTGQSS